MSRRAAVAAKPRARARRSAAGADLGGSSKYSNENFEGQEGKAGGRVQRLEEHRDAAGVRAFPAPLKTEDRKAATPGRIITASGLQVPNPSTVGGLLEPLTHERITRSAGDGLGTLFELSPAEQPTQNCALNVKVKKFNQALVNGGVTMTLLSTNTNRESAAYRSFRSSNLKLEVSEKLPQDNWLVAAAAHSDAAFDPSMSALPIIVKQNSPSVGLFTHQ
ncbi:hypothetical protein Bca52824_096926 [Brassica carinata]|uniref:Uncharacterized protein n=2 Tax=Mesangiospermae TaxID=1437183 RepID=A0A8X7NX49_BRACI|nr:hypothetical protein Bca52824_096926 [Brassica carinata]